MHLFPLLLCFLVVGVGSDGQQGCHGNCPRGNGSSVTAWLRRLDNPRSEQEALRRLRSIGPDDVPYVVAKLVELKEEEEYPRAPVLMQRFCDRLTGRDWFGDWEKRRPVLRSRRAALQHTLASMRPAPIQELLLCLQDKRYAHSFEAEQVLAKIGKEAVPALIALLDSPNDHSRDAACGAIRAMGREARFASSRLVRMLGEEGSPVRRRGTLFVLQEIDAEPHILLPVIVRGLKDPDVDVRKFSVSMVRLLGDSKKEIIPNLREACSDFEAIASLAREALLAIEKEE